MMENDLNQSVAILSYTIQSLTEALVNIDPKNALKTINNLAQQINDDTLKDVIAERKEFVDSLTREDEDAH